MDGREDGEAKGWWWWWWWWRGGRTPSNAEATDDSLNYRSEAADRVPKQTRQGKVARASYARFQIAVLRVPLVEVWQVDLALAVTVPVVWCHDHRRSRCDVGQRSSLRVKRRNPDVHGDVVPVSLVVDRDRASEHDQCALSPVIVHNRVTVGVKRRALAHELEAVLANASHIGAVYAIQAGAHLLELGQEVHRVCQHRRRREENEG